jgi:5-bromo-4-chloroindolyl phosphate hydrolysis protein
MSNAKPYIPSKTGNRPFKLKRGNFLYLFLAPLFLAVILALLARNFSAFLLNLIAFGLFWSTAKLNTIGLKQEYDYHTTTLTKAPKQPYKMFTALLLGLSTLYTANIAGGESLLTGLFLGTVATVGYFLYYGFDPREDKLDNIGDISAEFVIETLTKARKKLENIEENMRAISDSKLKKQLQLSTKKAHEILNTIEEDPKDLRVARKFIVVYIDGIENVTNSYVNLEESEINEATKTKLYSLLEAVEKRFEKELTRLKKNNMFDLDVNIDVLHQQIKN